MRRRLRPWDESPVILAPKAHEFLWPLKHQSLTEYVSAQSPGVSVPDVIDPPFDGSVKFSERDFAGARIVPPQMKADDRLFPLKRATAFGVRGVLTALVVLGENAIGRDYQSCVEPQHSKGFACRLWRWFNNGQYCQVSKMVAEIGRWLGGWMNKSSLR